MEIDVIAVEEAKGQKYLPPPSRYYKVPTNNRIITATVALLSLLPIL
jgi:hypothetical protein